ncbi:MAG: hypothetical protein AAF514_20470, partial [Verrucomicrobiota bacterium]
EESVLTGAVSQLRHYYKVLTCCKNSVLFFTGFGKAFGPEHLGKIQGAAQTLVVIASALGPWWLARGQESSGSYFPAMLTLTPVFVILGLLAWFTKLPQRVR